MERKKTILLISIICIIMLGTIAYCARSSKNNKDGYNSSAQISENDIHQNKTKWDDNEEIKFFREYLRIQSVHPNVDYKPCVEFLKKQAKSLGLPTEILYPVDRENPVLLMTLKGTRPDLPALMLNAHMDVVPVFPEFWKYPPFAAVMEDNGDIYARGAQDMKSVGMQYLAALRALKREGVAQFKRTIYLDYVPDEEVGDHGMAGFIKSDKFKSMNVGVVLDEGGSVYNDDGSLNVYYGERSILQVEFTFHGHSGHGSKLFYDTVGVKFNYVLGKLMDLRKEEERKFNELKYPYGNVTSINLTIVKGGIQPNVIPAEMSATFDIRVSVNEDVDAFRDQIHRWCNEAGGNITIHYLEKGEKERPTIVDDSNPYWVAYKSAFKELGYEVKPAILTGTTDSRLIRRLNITAFGFTPLLDCQPRQHAHNEYLNADTYLKGIKFFKKIIPKLANL